MPAMNALCVGNEPHGAPLTKPMRGTPAVCCPAATAGTIRTRRDASPSSKERTPALGYKVRTEVDQLLCAEVRMPPSQMSSAIVVGLDLGARLAESIDAIGERANARHAEVLAVIDVALDLTSPGVRLPRRVERCGGGRMAFASNLYVVLARGEFADS